MRLRNKTLTIILGLLLLNLAREYIFVKEVKEVQPPSPVSPSRNINFDIQKKDWNYYNSMFSEGFDPIKHAQVSLPLKLCGTIISDPTRSFAIIEDLTNKSQDLYKLGDMVIGAKIVAMNRNSVILDYKGAKQELAMSDMCKAKPCTASVQGFALHTGDSTTGIDFAKVLTQLRIRPYFEEGKCAGFQLSNINNGSIKQAGLQDGDIVESINGVKVDDPLRAMQMIYSIERNNPVHLGIERKDEKIELDCKVEG